MNYTEKVRQEYLESVKSQGKMGLAFATAVTKCSSSVAVYKNAIALEYEFHSYDVALKVMEVLRELFGCEIELVFNTATNESFLLRVDSGHSNDMLQQMNMTHYKGDQLVMKDSSQTMAFLTNREYVSSFMQGLFLCAGSVYIPSDIEGRGGYHLEFNILQEDFAEQIVSVLKECDLVFSLTERNNSMSVYTKNSQTISDFFAFIKAVDCAIELNDIIVKREVNNNINRQTNVYVSNADKVLKSNSRYIDAIQSLMQRVDLQKVDEKLYKVATARLEDFTESMGDMAERIRMSKSSVARALKKIEEMEKKYEQG